MLTVKLKQNVFITLRFYILEGPLDLIIGKKATVKHHILDMFPIQFGLETSQEIPLCTECKSYGQHSQCTNCSTPHDSIHEQPLNTLVPMDVDDEVSTTSWLAQHISQSILSSSLNHDIPSPSPDVDQVLSNGITENTLSSIHEVGEAEDSSYDDEFLSDDKPLVQGVIGIRVVPEGSSVPEQLHKEFFWKDFATPTIRVSHQATVTQNRESLRP